jgi:hypothetical protein
VSLRDEDGDGPAALVVEDAHELEQVVTEMLTEIPGFDEFRRLPPELKLTLDLDWHRDRSRREAERLGRHRSGLPARRWPLRSSRSW